MKNKKHFYAGLFFLSAFAVWTMAVKTCDLQAIGPKDSIVGFAALNGFFHRFTGVHLWLYVLTDLLSIIPLGIAAGFGLMGLYQLVGRKSLFKVDRDITALGAFYLCVISAYLFFEKFAVNYRPVLIDGVLEASYPSSTTMLVLCVMLTAAVQADIRIQEPILRTAVKKSVAVFSVFYGCGKTCMRCSLADRHSRRCIVKLRACIILSLWYKKRIVFQTKKPLKRGFFSYSTV